MINGNHWFSLRDGLQREKDFRNSLTRTLISKRFCYCSNQVYSVTNSNNILIVLFSANVLFQFNEIILLLFSCLIIIFYAHVSVTKNQ